MEKKDWKNGGTIKITCRGIFTRSHDKLPANPLILLSYFQNHFSQASVILRPNSKYMLQDLTILYLNISKLIAQKSKDDFGHTHKHTSS